jgi:6,7-dimethyl-8-ribityllumazine synthase
MKRKLLVFAGTAAATAALAGVAAAASAPTAVTGSATQVKQNTALLNGTVNPNGASTTYYFQVGLTNSYGAATAPQSAGSGVKAKGVSQTVGALVQGTTYHYRLVATNQFGMTFGRDRTFKTAGHAPPGVLTGTAVRLATTSATLTGAVFPGSESTTWWFQWGTTTAYGQNTAAQKFAPSTAAQLAVVPLQGLLAPGVIYHFRLVASHAGSAITYGADSAFMTYPSPRPAARVTARTQPFHPRHRPYALTTTGAVIPPSTIPAQYGCNGNVTIRFFRGLRQVGFTLAGIQPNCKFAARTVFNRIPGGRKGRHPVRLRVVVRSISNNYLATNRAPLEHVELG